jgi:hypothetical protein
MKGNSHRPPLKVCRPQLFEELYFYWVNHFIHDMREAVLGELEKYTRFDAVQALKRR